MGKVKPTSNNGHEAKTVDINITSAPTSVATEAQADIVPPETEQEVKEINTEKLLKSLLTGYAETANDDQRKATNEIVKKHLQQIAGKYEVCEKYNLIVLYDNGTLIKNDADRIYKAVTQFSETKPILLVLYSGGGEGGSAYLIGKLCLDYSKGDFSIAVPRMAKSAATLICCAATEIHMGSLSELGPIDPQINELPALGLKNAVEHLAEMVKKHPSASNMFSKYLEASLPLIHLGYYERVAESAMQYAERLLNTHKSILDKDPKKIANELVYKYKDHGFVIDKSEAEEIFGKQVVKSNTKEYELGNEIYEALALTHRVAILLNYNFYFIGSLNQEPVFTKKRPDSAD